MTSPLIERLEKLPVPILPTFVGALTLSNVYDNLGFTLIRHLTTWTATILILAYIVKIIKYPKTFKNEYSKTLPASLYAAFTMILMLLGAYYVQFSQVLGKALWSIGLFINIIHLLLFTYRNVLKNFTWENFLPSWFVTYNGTLVAVVTSGPMNEALISKILTYYGIFVYFLILPFMLYRLRNIEIKNEVYHTQAIMLAPISLCTVSYLTAIENPNVYLTGLLYIVLLLTLAFVIYKIPSFFSLKFTPAYAGMTFPMAIGIVGSSKMTAYLGNLGYPQLAIITKQISGIQIYLTTAIIGYILTKFINMGLGKQIKNS